MDRLLKGIGNPKDWSETDGEDSEEEEEQDVAPKRRKSKKKKP